MKISYILVSIFLLIRYDATSQKIYGFVDEYFCSHDLADQSLDTLIEFSDRPSSFSFFSTIDRFNGKYFFGGTLPGYPGNFHIIDLIDFHIESFSVSPGNMEYNYYREKIVYEKNGAFYSLDLNTMNLSFLAQIENSGGFVWGQTRTYYPKTNHYLHVDYPSYYLINARTGDIICEESNSNHPHSLTTNHKNGDIIGHRNGKCVIVSPCEGSATTITDIPGYQAHINAQMAVYDHNQDIYIVPYMSNDLIDPYKMAFVDVYNNKVLDIIDQPWGSGMDQHQLYDKPIAPIAQFNDTLFVPKGIRYNWYRDNEWIGTTSVNYWVPQLSGVYKAKIRYREYTTFSTEIQILITSLEDQNPKGDFLIYPNPVTGKEMYIFCDSKIDRLVMTDVTGRIVLHNNDINCSSPISLQGLDHEGVYFLTIESDGKLYTRSMIYLP